MLWMVPNTIGVLVCLLAANLTSVSSCSLPIVGCRTSRSLLQLLSYVSTCNPASLQPSPHSCSVTIMHLTTFRPYNSFGLVLLCRSRCMKQVDQLQQVQFLRLQGSLCRACRPLTFEGKGREGKGREGNLSSVLAASMGDGTERFIHVRS